MTTTTLKGPVTGDQVKAAVLAAGLQTIDLRSCGLCGTMLFYSVRGDQIFYNPACDCTPEPRTWDDPAQTINMQTRSGPHGDAGARMALRFGIVLEPAT